ncbi:hypothetical protein Tco_1127098, partial [Tanacetum coccineum]
MAAHYVRLDLRITPSSDTMKEDRKPCRYLEGSFDWWQIPRFPITVLNKVVTLADRAPLMAKRKNSLTWRLRQAYGLY